MFLFAPRDPEFAPDFETSVAEPDSVSVMLGLSFVVRFLNDL